jgi:hypothetical protein
MQKNKIKKILFLFILILNCLERRSEVNYTGIELVNLGINEITVIRSNEYLSNLKNSDLHFRFRFLPYIESKYEKIKINDFIQNYQIMVSYNEELFKLFHRHNFTIQKAIDQYHKVDLNLRYNIKTNENEEFFPTIILMIQQGKPWPGTTSFIGVGLLIYLRLSIFNIHGNEIAYCQKQLFRSIFSNYFFEDYVLPDGSPFLTDLNQLTYSDNINQNYIEKKIHECRKELNIFQR